jgi:hypothetical protein
MAPRRAVSRRLLPHGRRRAVSRAALLHRAALACPYRAVPASRRIRVMPRSCRTLSFSALPFRARTCPLCPALPRLSFPASACLTALRPPCHPALSVPAVASRIAPHPCHAPVRAAHCLAALCRARRASACCAASRPCSVLRPAPQCLSFPASACLTALRPPCHPALFGARRAEPHRAVSVSCPRSCRTLPCCALPCPPCLSLLRGACLAPLLCASPCPAASQLPCLTALRPPCHPALFGARRAKPYRAVSLAGAFRRALPPCRSLPAVVCPRCRAVSRERGPGAAPPMPFRRHSALTRRPAAAWSVQIVCIVAPYARAPRRVHVPQLARAAISPSQLISLSSRTRCRPRIATPPRGPSRADQAPAAHPLTPSNPNIPYGLGGGSGMRYFVSHGETRADFSRRFGAWSRTSGI